MSEEMLVCHCSPTLAGMKTGNLFSCAYQSQEEMIKEIRELNQKLIKKGIRILPVRISANRVLIYVYRPERLKKDFSDEEVQELLTCKGYNCKNPTECIYQLIRKLQDDPDFPHEIGLFLGYPAEDVKGFIENRAACCKCSGCWKVYGDEQAAMVLFTKYKKCRELYYQKWKSGVAVEQLTITI